MAYKDGEIMRLNEVKELGINPTSILDIGAHSGQFYGWAKPVWPKTLSLMGSPVTPYIFDDRCDWKDAADAIREWYDVGPEERERCGELGKQFVMDDLIGMHGEEMSRRFINSMDSAFENWKPRPRYTLEVV